MMRRKLLRIMPDIVCNIPLSLVLFPLKLTISYNLCKDFEPGVILFLRNLTMKQQNFLQRFLKNGLPTIQPTIREGYSDNTDEIGLFYKLKLDVIYHFKGEKCSNGNLSKDRIIVFVAANMNDMEKYKLFVDGKSRKLPSFKNIISQLV